MRLRMHYSAVSWWNRSRAQTGAAPQKEQLAVSPAAKDHIPTTEKSSLQRLKQTDGSVLSQGRAATRPAPREVESCCCFCRVWQRDSAAVVVPRWG